MSDKLVVSGARGPAGYTALELAQQAGAISPTATLEDFITYLAGLAQGVEIEDFPAAAVTFSQGGSGAIARFAQDKMREFVSVLDYGAKGDWNGTTGTDDATAFNKAVAAVEDGATIWVPGGLRYKLDSCISTGTKRVRWQIGSCEIICPTDDFAFSLDSNGSSLVGSGRGATIFRLRQPLNPVVLPTASVTLTDGKVTGVTFTGGANLHTTPLVGVSASPEQDDAALIPTVANGQMSELLIVAHGSGYVTPPTISIVGGGPGAIKINEAQGVELRGFSIDMAQIWHAVGVYHYGGWRASVGEFETIYPTEVEVGTALLIDSHTLGEPGPTGSYGGVYVSRYYGIYAGKIVVVGHDTSTATTLQFDTLEATNVIIHGSVGITLVNPIIQGDTYPLLDLVNTDGVTLLGGDMEGAALRTRVRGECNNLRIHGVLSYAGNDTIYGPRGRDWIVDFAKSDATNAPLRTGTNGTAGAEFQNTGWRTRAGHGLAYMGDVLNTYMNLKPISATEGNLFDTALGGTAMFMNTSGEVVVVSASAGANPRPLTEMCRFTRTGDMRLKNLPTSAPAEAGGLWNDGGTVKIVT